MVCRKPLVKSQLATPDLYLTCTIPKFYLSWITGACCCHNDDDDNDDGDDDDDDCTSKR